jgi:hypothetical protein
MSEEIEDNEDQSVAALNIDGLVDDNAKFVSNVTKIGWSKNSHKKWNRVINKIATVVKDEIHQGKNHTTVTLKAGSEVMIDDIRGRINPQYRVTDTNGKIWFVSATNLKFSEEDDIKKEDISDPRDNYIYRGGVRVDGTDEENDVVPKRYEMPATTEDEIKILKQKAKEEKKSNG